MFTGYNSNIERDGKVFHVQTEDKGLDNPVVETLVYSGGQVVAAVKNSYADLAQSRDYSEDRIQKRMKEQHQSLLEDLKDGRLKPDPKVRFRIDAPDLSREDLIHEYVEDWIETTATVRTVHRILEADIDRAQQQDTETLRLRRQKKKRALIGALLVVLSVAAAFELARLSSIVAPPGAGALDVAIPVESVSLAVDPVFEPAPVLPVESSDLPPAAKPVVAPAEPQLDSPVTAVAPKVAAPIVSAPIVTSAPIVAVDPTPAPLVLAERLLEPPVPAAAPPPSVEDRPYEAHEVDTPPTSIPTQLPVYTATALRRSREGSVRMNVLVGTDGRITAVRVTDEIEQSDLNRAALSAVLHWRFNAGSHHGQPVRVWLPVRLDFTLADNGMRSVVAVTRH